MQKLFSRQWISSRQPRKQRKYRFNAPMHIRQKFVSAHLDKSLRKEYNRRSVIVRAGDEVRVMRGEYKRRQGKVEEVDLKNCKIYVSGIVTKKANGQETKIPIDPSNIMITKLNTDDKRRMKIFHRKTARK